MVETLLKFECDSEENKGIPRPEFLSVGKHALPLIRRLIEIRPKEKLIIDQEFDPN